MGMKVFTTNRRIMILAVIGCLLLGSAIVFAHVITAQKAVVAQVAPDAVADLRAPHEHFVKNVRGPDTGVLISFFSGGSKNVIQHCYLGRSGHPESICFTPVGFYYGGGASMSDAQRAAIYAALGRLPASEPYKRDADAFFVSWNDGGKWTTRTYDRIKLPPEVRDLCTLMLIPPTWL
jgi:hypothetical protein